jgi:hypothetical protein
MKFFFVQGKRYKAIYRELNGVLREAAVSLATVKSWCHPFKADTFFFDHENKPGRSLSDPAQVIPQFLHDKPFLSASVLAKGLTARPHTIKKLSHATWI